MKHKYLSHFVWFSILVLILIHTACTSQTETGTPVPIVVPPAASPTPSPDARLTAKEIIVKRLREGDTDIELEKDDEVDIQVEDRISVEEKGRGLIRFQDNLIVEIFHNTDLQLADARLEPEDFIFVRLRQVFGHTRVELNHEAKTRIRLETDYATIESVEALDQDTEFATCHAKELTCMVTLQGAVEVQSEGQIVTVEAGEATYIFPGEPPGAAICADLDEVEDWMERFRSGEEDMPPLGALVIAWPQEPCTTETIESPNSTVPPLPTSEMMVNIAGGTYVVGDIDADDFHLSPKEIELAGFWIDQFEVTNARYQPFVEENGYMTPAGWPGGIIPAGQENHPVKGVTWTDAFAYCAWANKRLPSEAEWEVAARGPGPEPARYPWGPDPGAGEQVFALPRTDTYEVGAFPFNRSPFDVYDMAGNVWEWVGDPYEPVQAGDYILRGGRHGLLTDMAYRQPAAPDSERFVPYAGFRCAADHVEGE